MQADPILLLSVVGGAIAVIAFVAYRGITGVSLVDGSSQSSESSVADSGGPVNHMQAFSTPISVSMEQYKSIQPEDQREQEAPAQEIRQVPEIERSQEIERQSEKEENQPQAQVAIHELEIPQQQQFDEHREARPSEASQESVSANSPPETIVMGEPVPQTQAIAPSMASAVLQEQQPASLVVPQMGQMTNFQDNISSGPVSNVTVASSTESLKKSSQTEVVALLEAYCLKCRKKQPITSVEQFTMKNGRPALRGKCTVCGTNVVKMSKSETS